MENNLSLFTKLRQRILISILEEIQVICTSYILIVDRSSTSVLSSISQVYDITSRGAVVIESLEKPRKPMPSYPVLYFISPKSSSVSSMISDFSQDPNYKSAYVYFTGHLSQDKMKKIAESKLLNYIQVFTEANCNFRVIGPNQFSLESSGLLGSLFMAKSSFQRKSVTHHLSSSLASVCTVLNDFPYVAYQSSSLIAQELALATEDHLESLYRKVSDLKINDVRPVLIILDRTFDLPTCFTHDVHYESLLKDLFEIGPDGQVSYISVDNSNESNQKSAVINEFDIEWARLRYLEIDEAQSALINDLNEFRGKNKEIEYAQSSMKQDLKSITKVVKGLPEYNERISQFSVHRYLIGSCLKSFSDEGITEISEIEQMMMTGFNVEKENYEEEDVIEKAANIISRCKSDREKLRIGLMVLSCVQLSSQDRQRILDVIPPGMTINLSKLSSLGIDLKTVEKSKKRITKQYSSELKKKIPAISKIYNYYLPKLHDVISAALSNSLENIGIRYSRQAPPDLDPNLNPELKSLRKKGNSTRQKRKIILFIIGGVTYPELRISSDFPDSQIIIGGSSVVSPLEFVQELVEMSDSSSPSEIEPEEILLDYT